MVKHFNIIMAGVISGIVALFTSILGVSGTVIGSVLSSFLYQLISTYYEEKTQDLDLSQVGSKHRLKNKSITNDSDKVRRIVFIFPIIVILLIECLFALTFTHYSFIEVFNLLEQVTDQNLFRVMGLGLIVLSLYPFIKPKVVKRSNGTYLLIIGILLVIRGFVDKIAILNKIYHLGFYKFDLLFAILVIIVLLIIVVRVLKDVFKNSKESTHDIESKFNSARKVDTNFNNPNYGNYDDYDAYDNYDSYGSYDTHRYNDYGNYNPNQNYRNDVYQENNPYDYQNESTPIYEEDYIFVKDPNNPNRTIKKRILKKINQVYKQNNDYNNQNYNSNYNQSYNQNYNQVYNRDSNYRQNQNYRKARRK